MCISFIYVISLENVHLAGQLIHLHTRFNTTHSIALFSLPLPDGTVKQHQDGLRHIYGQIHPLHIQHHCVGEYTYVCVLIMFTFLVYNRRNRNRYKTGKKELRESHNGTLCYESAVEIRVDKFIRIHRVHCAYSTVCYPVINPRICISTIYWNFSYMPLERRGALRSRELVLFCCLPADSVWDSLLNSGDVIADAFRSASIPATGRFALGSKQPGSEKSKSQMAGICKKNE